MPEEDLTRTLSASRRGDTEATGAVWERVYGELRGLAHRELVKEQPGHTLSTTGLVHEAYFKLVGDVALARRDRGHFLALACRAMRQVLIDHARKRGAKKREGAKRAIPLEEAGSAQGREPRDLLELDQALTRLSTHSPRLAQVVELRFFGGLTETETAEVLGVTARTVQRDWGRARTYLYRFLSE